jgi:tetratricopeptide (TPR) repeat protein
MSKQAENLTFFCQLCDKSIETNICPQHGVDFVTIKKISHVQNNNRQSQKEERRLNGMMQLEGENSAAGSSYERRLATPEQIKKQAYLPVIPTNSEEQESLKPVPASKIPRDTPGMQYDNPLKESIEKNLNDQLRDYQETDDAVDDYYQYSTENQPRPQAKSKSKKGIVVGSLLVIALLSLFVAYFAMSHSAPSPTSIYSRAESYYENQNYPDALSLYIRFAEQFPNDPLMPIVSERIDMLTQQTAPVDAVEVDDQTRIKDLMIKANVALQKQQYVKPRNDNVIAYASAVLGINPNYQPALEMYDNVINHFTNLAEEALNKSKYNDAIIYYQTVLEIKPNDAEIIGKIHSILTQKDEVAKQ